MVQQRADSIQPPKVIADRRAEEERRALEKKKQAEKEGIVGVGLPSQPRQVAQEQIRHEVKMRPVSPRGPMGGTFSSGFGKDLVAGKPLPASAGYRAPGAPYSQAAINAMKSSGAFTGENTGMQVSAFASANLPSYLDGFNDQGFTRKGTKAEAELGMMDKLPSSVTTKLTGKMPDGSDAMGSATFVFSEETGQPLASRTRIVTRAPKPERAAKKEIKL